MHSANRYQLLGLAIVVLITVFCGWGYSATTVSTSTVATVQSPDNLAWD
jgi:hypothetical protein